MRIYLIGLMGSGKSTIGAALSSEMGFSFHDTDLLIQQRNRLSVKEIFEREGEHYFRSEEERLVHELVGENTVISCGGGLPFYNKLMSYLLSKGRVVYLYAQPDFLMQRLSGEIGNRPLLHSGESAESVLKQHFTDRDPVYRKAHLIVDIRNKSVTEIVEEIMQKVS